LVTVVLRALVDLRMEEEEDDINVNRQLNIYKHIKKKAANDAQLLMNRIALIQKEEERARKKIEQTKERAQEILSLRQDTEKRVSAYANATGEVKQLQQVLLAKNREQEVAGRQARAQRIELIQKKKKEEVSEMQMEKKYLAQLVIEDQEKAIQAKQKRREEIRRMEEEMKAKKEEERRERERRVKEFYEKKVAEEAQEAKKAEKLVRALEKKEREWIEKLRQAQQVQEAAFEHLETALTTNKESSSPTTRQSVDVSGELQTSMGSMNIRENGASPGGSAGAVKRSTSSSSGGAANGKKKSVKKTGGH